MNGLLGGSFQTKKKERKKEREKKKKKFYLHTMMIFKEIQWLCSFCLSPEYCSGDDNKGRPDDNPKKHKAGLEVPSCKYSTRLSCGFMLVIPREPLVALS